MKKALAIISAFTLILVLFACTASNSETSSSAAPSHASTSSPPASAGTVTPSAANASAVSPSAASASAPATPAAKPSPSAQYVPQGYFDAKYNYAGNKKFKIVYMESSSSAVLQQASDSFRQWAAKMNCSYSDFSANSDNELYVSTLQTYIDQKYDGFLLDPDYTVWPRLIDILTESKAKWMSLMTTPVDINGKQAHPSIHADSIEWGKAMANWVVDYAKKTWPDAKPSETGMLSIDFSAVPALHDRTVGEQDVWNKAYPSVPKNFFVGDGITTSKMDADTGYNLAAAIMSSNPKIKYWMICGCFDDYSQGAAKAAEDAGKQKNTVAISCGGTNLVLNWDQNIDSPWKAALYAAQPLLTQPVIGALYCFMSGQATQDTIWPEWVDKSKGDKYPLLNVCYQIITKDNYQEYLEWVDAYTGVDNYHYKYKGTQFSAIETPPTSYAGK